MATDRRALFVSLTAALALTGCRNDVNTCASADVTNNEDVQNAMNAMVMSVEELNSTLGEFGTASPQVVASHLKIAVGGVAKALTDLRQALGFPDSSPNDTQ